MRNVAHLARLAIPEDRIHPLRDQLAAVLTYIDRLRRLDLRSVEPMAHVGERANRLDDDVVRADTMEPFIKVPKLL